jgi:choline kinase
MRMRQSWSPASWVSLQDAIGGATPSPQMVILAAGQGERLRPDPDALPKPLTPLLGQTLLEHAVRAGVDAGVREFVVVIGYRADAMLGAIRYLEALLGVRIRAAYNADWELGNGASVLAAEPYVRGAFFLAMCDHVFAPEFLPRLIEQDDGRRPLALVVDHAWHNIDDVPETTKVRLAGRRIMAIGKRIERWQAVDTGAFLCRPALFDALREAHSEGDDTLSGGVSVLARRGDAFAVPGDGLFWHDIDTAADLQSARARLLAGRVHHDARARAEGHREHAVVEAAGDD